MNVLACRLSLYTFPLLQVLSSIMAFFFTTVNAKLPVPRFMRWEAMEQENLCNMPPMHTLLDISAGLETCPSLVSQGNGYISLCILIKLKEISSLCTRWWRVGGWVGGHCFTKHMAACPCVNRHGSPWKLSPPWKKLASAVQWPQRSCDHPGRWIQEPGENRAWARPGRSAENYLSCSRISLI